jgi:hypothetical protein
MLSPYPASILTPSLVLNAQQSIYASTLPESPHKKSFIPPIYVPLLEMSLNKFW